MTASREIQDLLKYADSIYGLHLERKNFWVVEEFPDEALIPVQIQGTNPRSIRPAEIRLPDYFIQAVERHAIHLFIHLPYVMDAGTVDPKVRHLSASFFCVLADSVEGVFSETSAVSYVCHLSNKYPSRNFLQDQIYYWFRNSKRPILLENLAQNPILPRVSLQKVRLSTCIDTEHCYAAGIPTPVVLLTIQKNCHLIHLNGAPPTVTFRCRRDLHSMISVRESLLKSGIFIVSDRDHGYPLPEIIRVAEKEKIPIVFEQADICQQLLDVKYMKTHVSIRDLQQ